MNCFSLLLDLSRNNNRFFKQSSFYSHFNRLLIYIKVITVTQSALILTIAIPCRRQVRLLIAFVVFTTKTILKKDNFYIQFWSKTKVDKSGKLTSFKFFLFVLEIAL